MTNTVTVTDVTGGDIIAHMVAITEKAQAFDALVEALAEHRAHLRARATSYYRQAEAYGDQPNARDTLLKEFAYGRGGAYACAADELLQLIESAGK